MTLPAHKLMTAGLVRRYHTVPDEGRGQTVAEHSWGVATLIATYHPDPSAGLLKAALTHDLAESEVGDLPAQVKWGNPEVAEAHGRIENAILYHNNWGRSCCETISDDNWLKAADILELLFYSQRRTQSSADEWHTIEGRAWDYINKLKLDGRWPAELNRAF